MFYKRLTQQYLLTYLIVAKLLTPKTEKKIINVMAQISTFKLTKSKALNFTNKVINSCIVL